MVKQNQPRILITGLAFGEAPRWHDGRLWLADWGTQEIIAVDPNGSSEVMMRLKFPSFQPICMDWQPDGRPLIISSKDNVLLRRESDGTLQTFVKLSQLPGLGWNEIVVDGRGNTYVNGGGSFTPGEASASGIIALVTPDGHVRQMADRLVFPNGMAITPDNSTLVVAESQSSKLTAFDIAGDGSLSNRHVWADLGEDNPDGICLDEKGAIWYADVPHKHCVRVREGGEILQVVEADRGCFACMLGAVDRKTLFIVTREWQGMGNMAQPTRTGQILAVEAPAAGAGWP